MQAREVAAQIVNHFFFHGAGGEVDGPLGHAHAIDGGNAAWCVANRFKVEIYIRHAASVSNDALVAVAAYFFPCVQEVKHVARVNIEPAHVGIAAVARHDANACTKVWLPH